MKNIKDYLHLYLGCQVIVPDEKYPDVLVAVNDVGGFISGGCDYPHEQIKLVLRPLSDMTEDEAREFIIDVMNMKDHFGVRAFNYKISKGFLSIETSHPGSGHYLIIKNWGKDGMGEWIFNSSYSMNDVVWLLKKSFDIFGLINEGLAVDSSTLTPKAKL